MKVKTPSLKALKNLKASSAQKYASVTGALQVPFIIVSIAWIVLYLVMFDYIRKLENTGCACSADWRRTYIHWYLLAAIFLLLAKVAVASFGDLFLLSKITGYGLVGTLFFLATIGFVVFSIQYVQRLKTEKCKCSEAVGRTVIHIVGWYYVILWAAVLLLTLFSIIMAASIVSALRK